MRFGKESAVQFAYFKKLHQHQVTCEGGEFAQQKYTGHMNRGIVSTIF